MSRLNKRALYQMAQKATKANCNESPRTFAEAPLEWIELRSVNTVCEIPDGRISGKLTASVLKKIEIDDGSSVSARARRRSKADLEGHSRVEIKQTLGSGSLGSLTNAYLEQQVMYDEELHTIQQRFYGLRAV
jgi:hypothetical protein